MEIYFIISLTTLPSRFQNLGLCIDSLLKQDYNNYEIHLNIPKKNKFEGVYKHKVKFNNDKLKIFYIDDIGPISKVFYTLQRTEDNTQRIISVDDDIIYHKDMLKTYNEILQNNKYFESCIGFAGIYPLSNDNQFKDIFFIGGGNIIPVNVGILEGYKSVCYKRGFFEDDFFKGILSKDFKWANKESFFEDDIILSSYLGYKNIEKIVMPSKFENVYKNKLAICVSFPIEQILKNTNSGCHNYRVSNGSAVETIQKFYNNEFGKYIGNNNLNNLKNL